MIGVLLVLVTLCSAVHAQSTNEPTDTHSLAAAMNSAVITQPRSILKALDRTGIGFHFVFVNDYSIAANSSGGSSAGFGRYSLDLSAGIDGQKLLGFKQATGLLRLKQHLNEFGRPYSCITQGYSNIDADSRTTLYELWLQQTLWQDRVRVKGGKMDANSEFAVVYSAGDFLNSSMGYSPTILTFPTYPEPKPGVLVSLVPQKNFHANAGFFETSGGGSIALLEGGPSWSVLPNELPGHAILGFWRLRQTPSPLHDGSDSGGFYMVAEQLVWKSSLFEKNGRQLTTFFQLGTGSGMANPLTRHIGTGILLSGPIPSRSQDSIGLATTIIQFAGDPNSAKQSAPELVAETYYKFKLASHFDFVPDVQFFSHDRSLGHPNCAVMSLRLVASF